MTDETKPSRYVSFRLSRRQGMAVAAAVRAAAAKYAAAHVLNAALRTIERDLFTPAQPPSR